MKPPDTSAEANELIALAIQEDLDSYGDITSQAVIASSQICRARIIAKQPGVIAGLNVAAKVFQRVDPMIGFVPSVSDGDRVRTGDVVAEVSGSVAGVLAAERIALNFLQRLSGIATLTARFVQQVAGSKTRILDTRKTTPGFRLLEKHAVRMGGGKNHRFGLYDMAMIKENHIAAAGSIRNAVERCRTYLAENGQDAQIEIEVSNLRDLREALRFKLDRIMLDNMSIEDIREAVSIVAGKTALEVSGGVSLATVKAIAATGVDYISVGALTHSADALDLSLLVEEVIPKDD
jgi:nicotinate-nucleotide pyrophosphorylase (carboxylating)